MTEYPALLSEFEYETIAAIGQSVGLCVGNLFLFDEATLRGCVCPSVQRFLKKHQNTRRQKFQECARKARSTRVENITQPFLPADTGRDCTTKGGDRNIVAE